MEQTEKKKKNKTGPALIAVGLILIAAAGALYLFNTLTDKKAGNTATQIAEEVLEAAQNNDAAPAVAQEDGRMPEIEIDGVKYIGIISIPALDVILPVQADWSLEKLRTSPCRYTGSIDDDSMIICAHNYRTHFGRLHLLSAGDTVYFTDASHLTYMYKVSYTERIDSYASEEMIAPGNWDLTLFTCNYNGSARTTVRLVRSLGTAQ